MKKFLLLFFFMGCLAFKNPAYAMEAHLVKGTVSELANLKGTGNAADFIEVISYGHVYSKSIVIGVLALGLASAAGLNLPAVAPSTSAIEKCIETGECYFPNWIENFGLSVYAMLGTLVPSYFTVVQLWQAGLQIHRLIKNWNSFEGFTRYYVLATAVGKWALAFFSGWAYGLGDQWGAKTVGENTVKLAAAGQYCKVNKDKCKGNPDLQSFFDTDTSYYDQKDVERVGEAYRVLNRLGSVAVGIAISLGFSNNFIDLLTQLLVSKFIVDTEDKKDILNSILGTSLDFKKGKLTSKFNKGGKVFVSSVSIVGIAAFFLFQYWDWYLSLGAELFNGAAIDQAQMDKVNNYRTELNKDKEEDEKLPLITTSNHGVIIPDLRDKNGNLIYASATLEDSTSMYKLINLSATEAQQMIDAKDKVGLSNYKIQYALLGLGNILNFFYFIKNWGPLWQDMTNPRKKLWRAIFQGGYLLGSTLSIIPYAWNLAKWIGGNGANRSTTINDMIDKKKKENSSDLQKIGTNGANQTIINLEDNTQNFSDLQNKESLLHMQRLKAYSNMFIILFAWIGGASPIDSTYDVVINSSKIRVKKALSDMALQSL